MRGRLIFRQGAFGHCICQVDTLCLWCLLGHLEGVLAFVDKRRRVFEGA